MNVACKDREGILRDAEPEALAALAKHTEECAECRAELEAWNSISAAAPLLRRSWESPGLWPRIRQALAEQAQTLEQAKPRNRLANIWDLWAANWKPALAAVALVVLTIVGVSRIEVTREPERRVADTEQTDREKKFLTEQAVKEIEAKEADYLKSMEKLAALAAPQVQQPSSPLMASYREKLIVLDAAIAELRANVDHNRFNAQLRAELISLYHEKQKTLEALAQGEDHVR